jgi:hypothetical protein
MNKKRLCAFVCLALLMLLAILGLPFTTRQIEKRRIEQAVYVTAPPPVQEDFMPDDE